MRSNDAVFLEAQTKECQRYTERGAEEQPEVCLCVIIQPTEHRWLAFVARLQCKLTCMSLTSTTTKDNEKLAQISSMNSIMHYSRWREYC